MKLHIQGCSENPINFLGNWLFVWRIRRQIMRTDLCRIVYCSWIVHRSQAHSYEQVVWFRFKFSSFLNGLF